MKLWLLPIILLVTAAGAAATLTVSTARPAPEQAVPQPQLPAFEAEVPPLLEKNGPEVAFKWQDKQGAWHYADQPPAGTPTQTLTLDPFASLLEQRSSTAPGNDSGAWKTPGP